MVSYATEDKELWFRMQMYFEKFDIDIPIRRNHAVASVMHVISEIVQNRLLCIRPYVGVEAVLAQQFVYGPGSHRREELTLRIRPVVSVTGLQQQRPWGNQRDQHMRVHGSFVRKSRPLRVVLRKLIRVTRRSRQVRDGFAIVAAAQGGATFARTAGDHRGKSLV